MSFELYDIHLESTTSCSANCFMCPHKDLNRKGEMDFTLFKKIADDALSLGCKRITPFRIGDPLVFKDLFKWIDYVKDVDDIYVSIFTNASNLTEDIATKLLERGNKIIMTISFHGHDKESYEKNMNLDFSRVRYNIISFMERNSIIPVDIYQLVDNPPADHIDKFSALWAGLPFHGVGSAPFMEWTGARKVSNVKLDAMKKEPDRYKRIPCVYIMSHLDVMYDGKVPLCCVDYQGEVIIGDLKYQSITDVCNSRLYQYYIDQHLLNGGCTLPLCKDCSMNITEV